MEINATMMGYIALVFFPVYFVLLYFVLEGSGLRGRYFWVGVFISPAMPLAMMYLVLLVYLSEKKHALNK